LTTVNGFGSDVGFDDSDAAGEAAVPESVVAGEAADSAESADWMGEIDAAALGASPCVSV
jgi:hypothetical protein